MNVSVALVFFFNLGAMFVVVFMVFFMVVDCSSTTTTRSRYAR